jgi:trigger factor
MSDSSKSEIRVETFEEGPVVRVIEVEIEARRVRKAFDRAYRDLAKEVSVKGFRPGKAPRSVLERLYGASLAEQIEGQLINETLSDAVELTDLVPVSEPAVDGGKPDPDAPFRYTVRIEVRPEVELPDLTGLPAIRPAIEVDDHEIDERLEQLRNSNAPLLEEPEGTQAAEGHVLTVDFVGRVDGELFEGGTGQGVSVEIGTDRFIPGFEEQLIGAVANEDLELSVRFPEDYGQPDLAGKDAVFQAHVVDVRRREVPELDDEFAKDLGDFETLAALRERVRADLASDLERQSKETFRTTILDALIERTEFDVPAGMIERQLESQLQAAHQRLEGQADHDALHAQLDRWREEWRPRAERDVREMILLQAIGEAEDIEIGDEEVDARLTEMLGDSEGAAAQLDNFRNDAQLTEALRTNLRDEKVLDFLGSQAKVEENTGT